MTDIADTAVIIDAGTLTFNEADLTATGLLIPFGVECSSNLGRFTFSEGDISLPEDLTGMGLNIEHRREDVVGAPTKVWAQPEGVMATFKYAQTPAGRAAFEDGKSGKRKNLSAEVAKVRVQGGKALPGAILFGAAQVEHPAFPGATLLASDTTEPVGDLPEPLDPAELFQAFLDTLPDETRAALVQRLQTAPAEEPVEPPAAPAEEPIEEEKEHTMTASAVTEPAGAVVPATLLASAAPTALDKAYDLGLVFGAMAAVKGGLGDGRQAEAETLLAALSDIKAEASGGLTTAASGVTQPAWVGKLWQGRRYQRKYIDLAAHYYGGIQLGGRKGFKLNQGTALVTAWAGNKTEIGSGTASTAVFGSSLRRYGYAADVAREWYDLEGGAEIVQAFFEGVVDSYAKITDTDALADIFLAASRTTTALDRLVAPGTFPAQAGIGTYPKAMGMLIQGIELVNDNDDEPAFAIANPTAWNQLLYTPKDLVPEYVKFAVRAGTGEADADTVIVRKAPQSAFTGTVAADPQIIVGAKNAIEFREQGTTPIQVEALDIAKGGVDKAVLGYLETFVVRPESLWLIGTKP